MDFEKNKEFRGNVKRAGGLRKLLQRAEYITNKIILILKIYLIIKAEE
jgi:hypothetical protein